MISFLFGFTFFLWIPFIPAILVWLVLKARDLLADWVILTTEQVLLVKGYGSLCYLIPRNSLMYLPKSTIRMQSFRLAKKFGYFHGVHIIELKKQWYGGDGVFCEFRLPLDWLQTQNLSFIMVPPDIVSFFHSTRQWSLTTTIFRQYKYCKDFCRRYVIR